MAKNDILDNIVSSISGDSDYQTWAAAIWGQNPNAEECDSADDAEERPAAENLPESRIFTLPDEPIHEGQNELHVVYNFGIVTWVNLLSGRDLADDLRTALDYIIKALMVDENRGNYAIFTDIVSMGEPMTEDEPLGWIRLDIAVYDILKEAS